MSQVSTPEPAGFEAKSGGTPIEWYVHFDLKPATLSVEYEVTNTRSRPIYLFNVLWELDKGKYKPADLPLEACLRRSGELHLAKMILPLPQTRTVYLRNVPFVTKVEPGQIYTDKLRLPLPVPEYNPYFPSLTDSKFQVVQAHSVSLTLQFVNDLPGMEASPAPLADAIRLSHPQLLALIETLQSRPTSLSVPVNKREDAFEEF